MFEINLVPDVKAEMIKAQKKRNGVVFASVAISIVAAAIVVVLLGIKVGQDITINGQDTRLEAMSKTIKGYQGLGNLLTVQKQLSDLQSISENKRLLSRVFTVLHSIVQQENGDEIKISAIDVDMENATLMFDGQADAGPTTDGIDYRVLESFTKSIKLMKYDYGRYVDKNGEEIPTMCIFESGNDGVPYTDENGIYAVWAKGVEGCDPSAFPEESFEEDDPTKSASGSSSTYSAKMQIQEVDLTQPIDGVKLVKIYRTPQFDDWYRKGYMTTDGTIEKIEHFRSECITYSAAEVGGKLKWQSVNLECDMSPDGLTVENSSNGKQTGGNLVLMFNATLYLNPEVFNFSNKHMITILPSGHQNVTDSFVQVGDMFAERAKTMNSRE
ncbi:hypothetical protein IKG31_03220 [Candidatus Saccharibacteria bacterium]|nr:hypothetical protein [Candidatus Saccharibacteria bacterium]